VGLISISIAMFPGACAPGFGVVAPSVLRAGQTGPGRTLLPVSRLLYPVSRLLLLRAELLRQVGGAGNIHRE